MLEFEAKTVCLLNLLFSQCSNLVTLKKKREKRSESMIYNINKARTNHSLSTVLFGFHSICAQSPYPYFVSIGLPKSWFGIFHNIIQNTRTHFLAKPIFNKYFLIINILSLKLMSSAYVITTATLEQPLAGSDFFYEGTCWRSVAI